MSEAMNACNGEKFGVCRLWHLVCRFTNTNKFISGTKHIHSRVHNTLYASKKTESQVDMKEAKRMTLFIIMINVSRNGINAIMKMTQLSIY